MHLADSLAVEATMARKKPRPESSDDDQHSTMQNLEEILSKIGVRRGSMDAIRLSRGVVGKTSYVALAAIGVLGVVAWNLREPMLLVGVGILAVLFSAIMIWKLLSF